MTGEWPCDAYGPEGREHGALCFLSETGKRVCGSPEECRIVMSAERRRVWGRIQEGAARGDPDMVFLAGEFTSPEQLLGGSEVVSGEEGTDA